ncbi:MAG: UDP-N-acetylglucosamine--N-acetylmuramyl-(pentapeptide) pyrophosphoryl-undecaprenol N-acetylglucosamine transferase [Planctomycetota bacterium]|nr:UDP-N-acetylglucosamine--N-acetylmuramyl-(pentapeptide) pyrophosphoryl-undecaprenol N-acetylglucosamine transferase [Planctomycetota bacterium]
MIAPTPASADRPPTVVFSGGGTVGHLAPGFALAEALEQHGVASVFTTPGEAGEEGWFTGRSPPHTVMAARIPSGVKSGLLFGPRIVRGVGDALAVIRRERAIGVVALGGWPCVPMVIAARMVGLPLAFIVADKVPGLVVRKLAAAAGRIYVPAPEAGARLPADRVVVSGPMLRADLVHREPDPTPFGLDRDRKTLLVFGGSLGARGLYERWMIGLTRAVVEVPKVTERMQVIHATGAQGEGVREAYERMGVRHYVAPFISDMGAAYALADFALARGGANTCAELLATATPSVIVPYPHHADCQQFKNAAPLVDIGLSVLIEEEHLTPQRIEEDVLAPLFDPERLERMRSSVPVEGSDAPGQTAADLIRFLGVRSARAGAAEPDGRDARTCPTTHG